MRNRVRIEIVARTEKGKQPARVGDDSRRRGQATISREVARFGLLVAPTPTVRRSVESRLVSEVSASGLSGSPGASQEGDWCHHLRTMADYSD